MNITTHDLLVEYPLKLEAKIVFVEVCVFTILVEVGLFMPEKARPKMGLALLGWIFLTEILFRTKYKNFLPRLGETGFRVKPLSRGVWVVALALYVGRIFLELGWCFGTVHGTVWKLKLLSYPASAFAQECALQIYVLRRLLIIFRPYISVLGASVIFMLCHVPNPTLMSFTFFAGMIFTAHYVKYRNMYWVVAAHFILGLCLSLSSSKDFLYGMRVGGGYWDQVKRMREEQLLQYYNRLKFPEGYEGRFKSGEGKVVVYIERHPRSVFLLALEICL